MAGANQNTFLEQEAKVGNHSNTPEESSELTTTLHLNHDYRTSKPSAKLEMILDSLSLEEKSILGQLSSNDAMLIVMKGPNRGARFLLDQGAMRIGREISNQIFLDDITVSRKHAVIVRTSFNSDQVDGNESQFEIRDEESLNGTYLNGISVKQGSLKMGDEIQIGKFRMHFFQKI